MYTIVKNAQVWDNNNKCWFDNPVFGTVFEDFYVADHLARFLARNNALSVISIYFKRGTIDAYVEQKYVFVDGALFKCLND